MNATPARSLLRAEVRLLFRQPLGWLLLALGQGAMAVAFMLLIIRYLEGGDAIRAAGVSVEVMLRYFLLANVTVLLAMPLLTMSTLAGDRRDGLLEFWYSTPISAAGLVGAKFAGVLALALPYVIVVSLPPLTLLWATPLDLGMYAGNVLALLLFTMLHAALGVLASAVTRAPLVAGVLALGASLLLWSAEWAAAVDHSGSVAGSWSSLSRLRGLAQGLVVSGDITYFVALTALALTSSVFIIAFERRQL